MVNITHWSVNCENTLVSQLGMVVHHEAYNCKSLFVPPDLLGKPTFAKFRITTITTQIIVGQMLGCQEILHFIYCENSSNNILNYGARGRGQ